MLKTSLLVCSLALAVGTGCKSKKTDSTPTPPATFPATTPAVVDEDLAVETVSGIEIDPTLATLCALEANRVFFKFDSANLRTEAGDTLDMLASCLTTGAATGKDLRIIGRTDPRGSETYNQELGMSRAESVASYLKDKGVSTARVDVISKGETDATPDRAGWPYDRRVTIRLAE